MTPPAKKKRPASKTKQKPQGVKSALEIAQGIMDDVITGDKMYDYVCVPSSLVSLNLAIRGFPNVGGYPQGAMTEVVVVLPCVPVTDTVE